MKTQTKIDIGYQSTKGGVDNRFAMQRAILAYLATVGQPDSFDSMVRLPRTGDVVDALGYPRNKASFASVSRSLNRLWNKGEVLRYYDRERCTRGKGGYYCLNPPSPAPP
jgi:hypothetical protein